MMVPPPPTSMTSAGERSQAIGSDQVNQAPAPLTMQPVPPPPVAMIRPPSANSAERSEAVGSEINTTPVSGPPFVPPAPNMSSMLPIVQDARSETIGAADQNYMQGK